MKKETPQSFFSLFNEIFRLLPGRRRRQFWTLFACMMLVSAIETMTVGAIALFATAVSSPEEVLRSDHIIRARDIFGMEFLGTVQGLIGSIALLVLLLVVLKNGFQSLGLYWVTRFGAEVEAFFGDLLFRGFLEMPYEWHLSRNSADLIIAVQWRSFIGHSFISMCLTTMGDIVLVLLLLSSLFFLHPAMSMLLLVIAGGASYLIYTKMHDMQNKMAERCKEFDQSLNRQVTKGIHGIRDVKISGQSSFAEDFKKNAYAFAITQGFRNLFGKLPAGIMEVVGFIMLTCTVCFMLFFMDSSVTKITATISLLVVAAWRILPAINRILTGFTGFRNMRPYVLNEIQHIREIESNINFQQVSNPKSFVDVPLLSEIRFEKVCFNYKARRANVLNDISFLIKKGQTIGFIGISGAGKSTLVDILIGLLVPSKGKVFIDGSELDDMGRQAWMKTVGYVPQSPYIYDGTLAGNVAFGLRDSEIDRELVLDCCHRASLHDVLAELPDGIDTPIGERGVRLSGGQQQRVVIARALYPRPEVMIFDEATSSLDAKSEKGIQDTIYGLRGKQTLIIIAHRLTTVKDCDLLFWIEDGRIKMADTADKVLNEYEKAI